MKAAQQLARAMLLIVMCATLYGGINLISDPTGSSLHLPVYVLNGTIFRDYTIPGYIMLGLAATALVALIALWRRVDHFHVYIILYGSLLAVATVVQMIIIGEEYILQYIALMLGMSIAILGGLLSQVRKGKAPVKKAH